MQAAGCSAAECNYSAADTFQTNSGNEQGGEEGGGGRGLVPAASMQRPETGHFMLM